MRSDTGVVRMTIILKARMDATSPMDESEYKWIITSNLALNTSLDAQ